MKRKRREGGKETQIMALKYIFTSALGRIQFVEKWNILVLTTHNSLYILNNFHSSVRICLCDYI